MGFRLHVYARSARPPRSARARRKFDVLEFAAKLIIRTQFEQIIREPEGVEYPGVGTNAHTWIAGLNRQKCRSGDPSALAHHGRGETPPQSGQSYVFPDPLEELLQAGEQRGSWGLHNVKYYLHKLA